MIKIHAFIHSWIMGMNHKRNVKCVPESKKAAMSVFQNFREIAFENFENCHAISYAC